MSFIQELKRRNVFRVGIAYVLMGWVVLQGADFALDLIDAPNWVIQAFSILVISGLPIALFLAWAFEMTPEGIKREADVDRSQSITPRTGRKLDFLIIGFLAVVIVLMGVERVFFAGQGEEPDSTDQVTNTDLSKSIAILPFDDLSQAGDQVWFADGLAEEILNVLAKTPDLKVTSRTASFRYRDSELPLGQIADELGVEHIVEGSVRSAGDRIRVTAQLIRADDGFHLWSENYDRDVDDMIAIQEDLATNIAQALETSMDPEALEAMAQAGTRSVDAYMAYLRGNALMFSPTTRVFGEVIKEAYEEWEQAVALDPGFAEAWWKLALLLQADLEPTYIWNSLLFEDAEEGLARFQASINQAIENAANDSDRRGYQAAKAEMQGRFRDATRLYKEYLETRPNDKPAWNQLFTNASRSNDRASVQLAIDYLKEDGLREINSAVTYLAYGYNFENPSEVSDYGLERLDQWPDNAGLLYQTHRALMWAGRAEDGAALARQFPPDYVNLNLVQARQACIEGRTADAEAILAAIGPEFSEVTSRWLMFKFLGRDAEASEALKPITESVSDYQVTAPLQYAIFDPTPHPRVMEILEREGVLRPPPMEIPFKCPPPEETSIAVLPFVNMSADPDNEYFSDGVSEEILNVLAGIPELKVTARTSAFAFKDSGLTVEEIADELGVNYVLEGSVRKAGNQVRVTAQLIKADDSFHMWSQTYDRELDNIFAIQDEIAGNIADALKVHLAPEPEAPNLTGTTNSEAYDAYLRGINQWHLRTAVSLQAAEASFRESIALDPGFARAHAGLAMTYAVYPGYIEADRITYLEKTRQAAEAALALDDGLAEAAAALIHSTDDMEAKLDFAETAIALNPSFATAHQWRASALLEFGDIDAALESHRKSFELDPRSRIIGQNYGDLLRTQQIWDESTRVLDHVLSYAPDFRWALESRLLVAIQTGDREGAETYAAHLASSEGFPSDSTQVYLDLMGSEEQRDASLAWIAGRPVDDWSSLDDNKQLFSDYGVVTLLAWFGAAKEALRVMKDNYAMQQNRTLLGYVRSDRNLANLNCREDTQAFYNELGLPPLKKPYPCEEEPE